MKKVFLLMAMAVFVLAAAYAQQQYHPVPFQMDNVVWYEYYVDLEAYETKHNKGNWYHYIQLSLDTSNTIQGSYKYKRVNIKWDSCSVFLPTSIYVREDTVNRRIFYKSTYSSAEHLIYDFSLNVGDTALTQSLLIVQSIDTVNIGGVLRKKINFSHNEDIDVGFRNGANYQQELSWIEGIGSTQGLIYPICIREYGANVLVCYSSNDSVIYHNSHFTDCFPSNTIATPETIAPVTAYPNPAKDRITFDFGGAQFETLQVINTAGVVVREVRLGGQTQYSMPINGLPSGVYVYRLQNEETATQGKIVVE